MKIVKFDDYKKMEEFKKFENVECINDMKLVLFMDKTHFMDSYGGIYVIEYDEDENVYYLDNITDCLVDYDLINIDCECLQFLMKEM